ncbi:MAG: FAD-dependent oxidoreductase [Gammaproteobacteria bacterium]|nr:FAD-dependent oxidoreductase [Gammaproteobacteria bacterium]
MPRDARYDLLFEPVPIGPVTARNRFYQVPHCTGMGYTMPQTVAAMRAIKAQGGWAVVCTEYCSIHPSSDDSPYAFCTLWDERDVHHHKLMTDAVHEHGALAGVELWHGGMHVNNRLSRHISLAPSDSMPYHAHPMQVRGMDKQDIRELRRWHVVAARRARTAGFDIVYVYAGHDYLPFQFLSRRHNRRHDEYGGSLENRVRLLRELIEETKEAVGDRCAVAVRLAVDELQGADGITCEGEGRDVVAMLADLPDLWDVNVSGVENDSCSARFSEEGFQEAYIGFVKSLTTKPVVAVGRYTSPDRMVSLVQRGVLDFIGAARPSIADPFLPMKIEQGRLDEIRECIGCNICRSGNNEGVPIRCTQNPTMGEEWRRGWHPEVIPPKTSEKSVLVVGGGPAGLEAARALGQRGYTVTLAEAATELGGRINRESRLPGLSTWARVRDWRIGRLHNLPNVDIYLGSQIDASHVAEFAADHTLIATGAYWRRDGQGTHTPFGVPGCGEANTLTPDEIMAGSQATGPVLIYDDDHYYMGGVLAEQLATAGLEVRLVTPHAIPSSWTSMTDEQGFVQQRLLRCGVNLIVGHVLEEFDGSRVRISCVHTRRTQRVECATLVPVTMRDADDPLYRALTEADTNAITALGDCAAPGAIVHAIYAGHRFAREFDSTVSTELLFRRERAEL